MTLRARADRRCRRGCWREQARDVMITGLLTLCDLWEIPCLPCHPPASSSRCGSSSLRCCPPNQAPDNALPARRWDRGRLGGACWPGRCWRVQRREHEGRESARGAVRGDWLPPGRGGDWLPPSRCSLGPICGTLWMRVDLAPGGPAAGCGVASLPRFAGGWLSSEPHACCRRQGPPYTACNVLGGRHPDVVAWTEALSSLC